MARFLIILAFMSASACAHRHHDHTQTTATVEPEVSVVAALDTQNSAEDAPETEAPDMTDTVTEVAEVPATAQSDVIEIGAAIITTFDGDFDLTLYDRINDSAIADPDSLPMSDTATFSGHALLADSIEGTVNIAVNFSARSATGDISDMTYLGPSGVSEISGQVDMIGQTVSRIGLKFDVAGTVSSDLTGSGTIAGTVRGVFHNGDSAGFAGQFSGTSTLSVLTGPSVTGPIYAN